MFSKIKLKIQKLEWDISAIDPKEANYFSDVVPSDFDEIDITEYLMDLSKVSYELETIENNELYFQEQNFDIKLSGISNNSFLQDYFNINGTELRKIIKKYKVTMYYDNVVKFRGFIEQKALNIEFAPKDDSEIITATIISMTNEFKDYYDKKPLGDSNFISTLIPGYVYTSFYNYISDNVKIRVNALGDVPNWLMMKDAVLMIYNDIVYYVRGGWSFLDRSKVTVYEWLRETCVSMGWIFYIYNNELVIRPRSTTTLNYYQISESNIKRYKKSFDSNYNVFTNVILNSAFYHNEQFGPEISKYNGSTIIDISNENYYFNTDPIGKLVDEGLNIQENRNVSYLNTRDDKKIEYTIYNKTGNSTHNYIQNSTFNNNSTAYWTGSVNTTLTGSNNKGQVTANYPQSKISLSTTVNVPSSSYYYLTFNPAFYDSNIINDDYVYIKAVLDNNESQPIEQKRVFQYSNPVDGFAKSFYMTAGTHQIKLMLSNDSGNHLGTYSFLRVDDVYLYQVVDGVDKISLPKYRVLDLNNKTTEPKYRRRDFNNGVLTNWEPGVPIDSRDFCFAGTYGDMLFKTDIVTNDFDEKRLYSYQEYVKSGALFQNYKKFLNQTYLEKLEVEFEGMHDELLSKNLEITGNGKLAGSKWSINKFEVDYINETTKAEIQRLST